MGERFAGTGLGDELGYPLNLLVGPEDLLEALPLLRVNETRISMAGDPRYPRDALRP